MMALSKYDKIKLDHDLKRIAKGLKLVRNEKDKEKRDFILDLLMDEFDRLQQDIEEMSLKSNGE